MDVLSIQRVVVMIEQVMEGLSHHKTLPADDCGSRRRLHTYLHNYFAPGTTTADFLETSLLR
jgi:hypothetical protein